MRVSFPAHVRSMPFFSVLSVAAALMFLMLLGSGSTATAAPSAHQTAQVKPMPLVAPLFIEGDGFTSELVMVNGSSVETFADVVLTGLNGGEIARERVYFTPHSQRRLEIAKLLKAAFSDASTGRIEVVQSAELKSMVILAQLLLTFGGSSGTNYVDEEVSMPSASGSQFLRGVADGADGSPLVAVTSLSEVGQRVKVECLREGGHPVFSKTVDLLAGETLLTEACTERTLLDGGFGKVREGAATTAHGPVGIALASDAPAGSFAAFGLTPHRSRGNEFYSGIVFDDPKMAASLTTVFAGVPVGSTDLLAEGKFVPEVSVANFSTKAAKVRVRYARSVGGASAISEVDSVVVPARSTRKLNVGHIPGEPGLRGSFLVVSDGSPGDIVTKLVSRSDSTLREVELLGKDEREPENGGSHPWSLEGGTNSTLLLFNHSGDSQTIEVFLSRPDALWQKAFHLGPMQTEAIDFRELLDNQVRDDHGRMLPSNILGGQVGWFAYGLGKVKGRILQSNRKQAMARSFSCTESYSLTDALFTGQTTTMNSGDTVTFGSVIGVVSIPVAGEIGGCGGSPSTTGGSYSISWSSDTPTVIAISGPSDQATVSVQGVTGGQATVRATLTDTIFGCTASAGGVGTVNSKITGISQDVGVWFFGTGLPVPAGFTLGSTGATLTATGATKGKFQWSVSVGTSKAAFENGSTSITKTDSNTVKVFSKSFSTAMNDVTIQITYTPSGGTQQAAVSKMLTIDSPYKLTSNGSPVHVAVSAAGTCDPNFTPGTDGYLTSIPYKMVSFTGLTLANTTVNEAFGAPSNPVTNDWPANTPLGFSSTTGTFADNACSAGALNPQPRVPQSPLTTTLVRTIPQTWYVGSKSSGLGVQVQTDTLQYFLDHAAHVTIVSPVPGR